MSNNINPSSVRYHLKKLGTNFTNQQIQDFIDSNPDLPTPQLIAQKMTNTISTIDNAQKMELSTIDNAQKMELITQKVSKLEFKPDETRNIIQLLVETYQDRAISYLDMLNQLEIDLAEYLKARNLKIKEKINESNYRISNIFTSANEDLNDTVNDNNSSLNELFKSVQKETDDFKVAVAEKNNFFRTQLDLLG